MEPPSAIQSLLSRHGHSGSALTSLLAHVEQLARAPQPLDPGVLLDLFSPNSALNAGELGDDLLPESLPSSPQSSRYASFYYVLRTYDGGGALEGREMLQQNYKTIFLVFQLDTNSSLGVNKQAVWLFHGHVGDLADADPLCSCVCILLYMALLPQCHFQTT